MTTAKFNVQNACSEWYVIIYKYMYIHMIKISGRVDKSNTYNGFSGNITFFIQ